MKHALMILTALLTIASTTFGQSGTDSSLVPNSWLRKGMVDIVKGEMYKTQLDSTNVFLDKSVQIISLQKSVIAQDSVYIEDLNWRYDEQLRIQWDREKDFKKEIRRRGTNRFIKGGLIGMFVGGVISAVLISKK